MLTPRRDAAPWRMVLLLTLGLTARAESAEDPKPAEKPKEDAPAKAEKPEARDPSLGGLPGDAKATGAIAGRVVLVGKAPEGKAAAIPADHKDRTVCGHEVPYERVILGPGNVLANAVVSLDKVPSAPKAQKRSITLDNVHCRFVPHVQATTAGSSLKVTSQDAVLHSAMAVGATGSFNVSVSPGRPAEQVLRRPGWYPVKCAVHSWMEAHIWVFPHDFFAVTGKQGKFRIEGIPPGKYKLKLWHQALEESEKDVTVEAGKTVDLNAELKPYDP